MFGALQNIRNKLITFFIKRFFGPYVKNFNLDQFSLGLSSGIGGLKDVILNCQEINLLLDAENVPFELVEGYVKSINVSVPWSQIFTESCQFDINGLYLHVQPKIRSNNEKSSQNQESIFTSLSPSVLAEQINAQIPEYIEGEEMPAIRNAEETITAMIFNIRCHLENTVIRFEPGCNSGMVFGSALELHIKTLKILPESVESEKCQNQDENDAFLKKLILLETVSLYLDCFQKSSPFDSVRLEKQQAEESGILLVKFTGVQKCQVQIKLEESVNEKAPKFLMDFQIETVLALLSPMQFQILQLMWSDFDGTSATFDSDSGFKSQIHPGVLYQGWTSSADSFEKYNKTSFLQSVFDQNYRMPVETEGNLCNTPSIPESKEGRKKSEPKQQSVLSDADSTTLQDTNVFAKLTAHCETFVVAVFQEDVLALNDYRDINTNSVRNMQSCAHQWFAGFTDKCVSNSNQAQLELNCSRNRVQLLMSDILVESTIPSENDSGAIVEGSMSFGNLELNEFLSNSLQSNATPGSKTYKILYSLSGLPSRIFFKLLRPEENIMEGHVSFELEKFTGEIDPSIIERLNLILDPEIIHSRSWDHQSSKIRTKIKLKFSVEELDLDFRVPVTNTEKTHLVENLRPDCINLSVRSVLLKSEIDSEHEVFQAELSLREGQLGYKASPDSDSVWLVGVFSPSSESINVIDFASYPPRPAVKEDDEAKILKNFGERVILGDKDVFLKIKNKCSENVQVMVSCKLSSLQVFVLSKDVLDSVSSLIEALLLWEPQASARPKSLMQEYQRQSSHVQSYGQALSTEYDSDNETYYSIVGGVHTSIIIPSITTAIGKPQKHLTFGQTQLVVDVHISNVLVSLLTPFKDVENKFILGYHGQITLAADNLNLFFASKYKGNASIDYAGIRCQQVSVLHCDLLKDSSEFLLINDPQMKRILVPSDPGVTSWYDPQAKLPNKSDVMLAMAVTLDTDKSITNATVYVGLQNATFHQFITLPNRDCFSQLSDFFGTDETKSSGLLHSVHVNLSKIAVTYAPLQETQTTRILITLEQMDVLLYMDVTEKTTIVHFTSENTGLLLTNKKQSSDVINDYVRILNMDLFKILVKIYNYQSEGPEIHLEMGSGNSLWNVTACSDSLKMLLDLVVYISNDGDLVELEDYFILKALQNDTSVSENLKASFNIPLEYTEYRSELFRNNLSDAMKSLKISEGQSLIFPEVKVSTSDQKSPSLEQHVSKFETSLDSRTRTLEGTASRIYPCLKSVETSVNDPLKALVESVTDLSPSIELSANERCVENLFEDTFEFVDNYFADTSEREISKDVFIAPEHFPTPVKSFSINDMSFHISLFGGRDFGRADEMACHAVGNSTDNGTTSGTINENKETINSSSRNREMLVEFLFEKLKFQHSVYPENTQQSSRQVLAVHRFEVTDKVKTSRFKKVLYLDMPPDVIKNENPRMFIIVADHARPEKNHNLEECFLEIQVKPLQVTLDQETLIFLLQYFERLQPSAEPESETVKMSAEHLENTQVAYSVDEDAAQVKATQDEPLASGSQNTLVEQTAKIYFREIKFSPDVPIRLDYNGKMTFDFVSPSMNWLTSLLMGIGQLDNAQIKLIALKNDRGILGVESVINYFAKEWTTDINQHQLPEILKGVDIFLPANAFVQLYQGAKDLFVLPTEQYRKDGDLVYGIQLGLTSFSSSTINSLLQLTNRLVQAIQATAEVTYDIVSSGQSIYEERQALASRSHPSGIVDGVTNACAAIVDGVGSTAANVVAAASAGRASKGIPGAIGAVLREIPPTVVKPVIIAAEATSNVIEGAKAQINPNLKREFDEKRK